MTTRTPAACLRAGARLATIDAAPRVLQTGCAAVLPRVDVASGALAAPGEAPHDTGIAELLAAAAVLRDHHVPVSRIGRDPWGGIEATTVDGIDLRLGADERELDRRAALVGPIRSSPDVRGRRLAAIDLRAPGAPVVRFR